MTDRLARVLLRPTGPWGGLPHFVRQRWSNELPVRFFGLPRRAPALGRAGRQPPPVRQNGGPHRSLPPTSPAAPPSFSLGRPGIRPARRPGLCSPLLGAQRGRLAPPRPPGGERYYNR